ncbi:MULTISPECIES: CpaD family pilus assembly protein [Hyphomonas]|uniref:Pilus assembly protein CpaD n=1 Tax=Hyphomonas jannaschiana VP2 TaxID=1280952 RepID=A0A059FL58_9PROT|nr:CpaD family pilus assembly protein [Hyphomonas jannaschiana]KCZ91271.1 pilus assembly protein CpaD [Hyphomonas jannaschiana VP2]
MTRILKPAKTLLTASLCLTALAACSSAAPTSVPKAYLQGTALDRNPIGVEKSTEFLEIAIHPEASELSLTDKASISSFVAAYRDHGHGPLIMSLPASSSNPQLAVAAVAEARAIAYERGVQYSEISGTNHGAGSDVAEPMILAFQSYKAVAPECRSLAEVDFSDVTSNNEMPTLGCAVRSNMAAMIADPADLLGNRPLEKGDPLRRAVILEKFRQGETTASKRTSDESGTVSQAISN